jgi:hypothetical protein
MLKSLFGGFFSRALIFSTTFERDHRSQRGNFTSVCCLSLWRWLVRRAIITTREVYVLSALAKVLGGITPPDIAALEVSLAFALGKALGFAALNVSLASAPTTFGATDTALDIDITLALDLGLFTLDGLRDAPGLLDRLLAKDNLFALHRAFFDRHFLLTNGNAIGLTLGDRNIGRLARASTALDVDFLAGDGNIDGLLLGHYLFAYTNLALLD